MLCVEVRPDPVWASLDRFKDRCGLCDEVIASLGARLVLDRLLQIVVEILLVSGLCSGAVVLLRHKRSGGGFWRRIVWQHGHRVSSLGKGDDETSSDRRDRVCDVPFGAYRRHRGVDNFWVGETFGILALRGERLPSRRSGSRMQQCRVWRDDGNLSNLALRSDLSRARFLQFLRNRVFDAPDAVWLIFNSWNL